MWERILRVLALKEFDFALKHLSKPAPTQPKGWSHATVDHVEAQIRAADPKRTK